MMPDPFEILGLAKDASKSQIKKRYRHLSKRFHPDLNPNDPEVQKNQKGLVSS